MSGQQCTTPNRMLVRLAIRKAVLAELEDGINGRPFRWAEWERRLKTDWLKSAGFTLVTKSAIKNNGRRLKRGAKPIGEAYFGAPIQKHAPLFLQECQTVEVWK